MEGQRAEVTAAEAASVVHNSETAWLEDWAQLDANDQSFPSSELAINLSLSLGMLEEFGPFPGEWGASYEYTDLGDELSVLADMLFLSENQAISRFLPIYVTEANAYFWSNQGSEHNLDVTKVELPVRPVFYLNNDIQYVSGTGTIEDPFIIK